MLHSFLRNALSWAALLAVGCGSPGLAEPDVGPHASDAPAVELDTGTPPGLDAASDPGSDAATGPGSTAPGCEPPTFEAETFTLLDGALALRFEDIREREGLQHVELTNRSEGVLMLDFTAEAPTVRVGVLCPQPNLVHLAPGESMLGFLVYYREGSAPDAPSHTLTIRVEARDPATGRHAGRVDSLERSISFVRGSEVAMPLAREEAGYVASRLASDTADVGFWRSEVDAAETRIVLFPGQENWTDESALARAEVRAYSLEGTLLWQVPTAAQTWGGDVSDDGRFVAYATLVRPEVGTPELVLLDATDGRRIASHSLTWASLPEPAEAIPPTIQSVDAREVRFSDDGSLVAVGTSEGRVVLFAVEGLVPRWTFQARGQARGVTFDGDALLVGSGDGLLRRVRLEDGAQVFQSYVTSWPYSEPDVHPDGGRVVVGAKAGGFTVLDAETGACLFRRDLGTVRRAFFTEDGATLVAASGTPSAGTSAYRTADWSLRWSGPMSAAASATADSSLVLVADGDGALIDVAHGTIVLGLDTGFADRSNYFKTAYVSRDGNRAVIARRDLAPSDVAISFFRIEHP